MSQRAQIVPPAARGHPRALGCLRHLSNEPHRVSSQSARLDEDRRKAMSDGEVMEKRPKLAKPHGIQTEQQRDFGHAQPQQAISEPNGPRLPVPAVENKRKAVKLSSQSTRVDEKRAAPCPPCTLSTGGCQVPGMMREVPAYIDPYCLVPGPLLERNGVLPAWCINKRRQLPPLFRTRTDTYLLPLASL